MLCRWSVLSLIVLLSAGGLLAQSRAEKKSDVAIELGGRCFIYSNFLYIESSTSGASALSTSARYSVCSALRGFEGSPRMSASGSCISLNAQGGCV